MVRRFQAVIEVTGKEEAEVERFDLEVERLSDAGVLHPTPIPTCSGDARQRKSSSGLLRVSDVHLRIMLMIGRKQRQMRRTRGRKGGGRRKVENAMGMLTRGKTLSRGRIYICHGPDEEDDELMMYANLKALYSSLASPFLTQPN